MHWYRFWLVLHQTDVRSPSDHDSSDLLWPRPSFLHDRAMVQTVLLCGLHHWQEFDFDCLVGQTMV